MYGKIGFLLLLCIATLIVIFTIYTTDIGWKEESGVKSFTADTVKQVILDSDMANVEILPATPENGNIKVKWDGSLLRSDHISIETKGDALYVDLDRRSKIFNIPFLSKLWNNKFTVQIYLPKKEFDLLSIANDVGETKISSIDADVVQAETSVSSLTAEHIQAKQIDLRSDVGKIDVKHFSGELTAKSNVGKISIFTDSINSDMDLSSDVGQIDVSVQKKPDNVLFSATSDVGGITMFGQKGDYVQLEAEYIVTIKTSVGKISVNARE